MVANCSFFTRGSDFVCVYVHVCVHVYVYVCDGFCLDMCVSLFYVFIYTCLYVYIDVCVCVHPRTRYKKSLGEYKRNYKVANDRRASVWTRAAPWSDGRRAAYHLTQSIVRPWLPSSTRPARYIVTWHLSYIYTNTNHIPSSSMWSFFDIKLYIQSAGSDSVMPLFAAAANNGPIMNWSSGWERWPEPGKLVIDHLVNDIRSIHWPGGNLDQLLPSSLAHNITRMIHRQKNK